MAEMAKSPKDNNIVIIKVYNKNQFIQKFNDSKPSKEFFNSCKKAGKLFGIIK